MVPTFALEKPAITGTPNRKVKHNECKRTIRLGTSDPRRTKPHVPPAKFRKEPFAGGCPSDSPAGVRRDQRMGDSRDTPSGEVRLSRLGTIRQSQGVIHLSGQEPPTRVGNPWRRPRRSAAQLGNLNRHHSADGFQPTGWARTS